MRAHENSEATMVLAILEGDRKSYLRRIEGAVDMERRMMMHENNASAMESRPRTAPGMSRMMLRGGDHHVEVRAGGGDFMPLNGKSRPNQQAVVAIKQQPQLPPTLRQRPAGQRRGQVRAAIAHSVLQTLSSFVKNARSMAFRRSFS